MSEVISLADKLARAKARLESAPTGTPTPPTPPSIPKPPEVKVTFMADARSENDHLIDTAINGLDIISAYNLFAGKGAVDAGGKTEGIKVRCPNPSHPDRDPSAWINTEKQTWYCGGCAEGGDKFDIAAWYFGLPVPGYKDGRNFHELRRRMAESQGYVFQPVVGGKTTVVPPAAPEVGPDGITHVSAPVTPPDLVVGGADGDGAGDGKEATVTAIPAGPISALEDTHEIALNWRPIIEPGTFLDVWMKQTTIDDVPEEYHFWNGMIALAMACGRDVTLQDFRPVYANMFVCMLGRTGAGKSKGTYLLNQLLEKALPYKHEDPFSKGALRVASPQSAEALIWVFQKKIEDPSAPKKVDLFPVKGIVDFNELSSLIGRAQRAGNVIIPTLMQFYDMESTIEVVSRTHGVEKAVQPFACAVTTSQPRSLRGLLTVGDAASGFLNRWLFVSGKEKMRSAIGGAMVNVVPAVKPLQDVMGWAATAGSLEWSQEANDLFTSFFHNELQPIMRADETDLLNRMDLLCKKLILLFTANMKHKRVEVEAVEQMMKLYPYLLECYGIPGATIGNSLQNEIREAILKIVIDHQSKTGKGASNRDIQQRVKQRKYPLDLYNRTLKYMSEIEEIVVMPSTPGPGRPTTRYGVPDLEDAKEYLAKSTGKAEKKAGAK